MRMRTELRLLRAYVLANTAIVTVGVLAAFAGPDARTRFDEITVERINVVEKNGKARLVIANRARSPGVVLNGKTYNPPGNRAGVIFYNDEGVENGGLIFGGGREKSGEVNTGLSLTFDQYDQDQVVALQHIEEGGRRYQGLTINDRPDVPLGEAIERERAIDRMPAGPGKDSARAAWVAWQGGITYGARRLFVGRSRDRAAVVNLADPAGKVRLRLLVDSLGAARIDFLDAMGRVTNSLPEATRGGITNRPN